MSEWKPSKEGAKISDAKSVQEIISAMTQIREHLKAQIEADKQTIESLRAKIVAAKTGGVS